MSKPKQQGPGQPPRAGTASTYVLHVRLTDEERARLEAKATAAGVTVSEYVRRRVLR